MKTVDVKVDIYINVDIEKNDKGPKFKVGDHVRCQYTKIFLQKDTHQIGLKKFLWSSTLRTMYRVHMSLKILKVKKQ